MAIIAHIDLDAFFASCEVARNPAYEEKAVVVCMFSGRGEDGGAVSTCDYDARELGVHAGMAIVEAKKIVAESGMEGVFVQADKEYYREVSDRIMEVVAAEAQEVEQASVDEVYADFSHLESYEDVKQAVDTVRDEIKEQEDVTASAGIGPNKLVAKMASDEDKPDGCTVIQPEDVERFLADKPVEDLYGVGPKTADTLQDMGADMIGDITGLSAPRLVDRFGETRGIELYEKAQGKGSTKLEDTEKKQLSRINTLPYNTRDMGDIRSEMRELAQDVVERAEDRGVQFSRVAAIFITADRETRTRSRSLGGPMQDAETVYRTAEELTGQFLDEYDGELRRVGVRVGGLQDDSQERLSAF